MNKISGQKALDKLNEKYTDFIKSYHKKPMSNEIMCLITLIEGYALEANYYHDKFVEMLYMS